MSPHCRSPQLSPAAAVRAMAPRKNAKGGGSNSSSSSGGGSSPGARRGQRRSGPGVGPGVGPAAGAAGQSVRIPPGVSGILRVVPPPGAGWRPRWVGLAGGPEGEPVPSGPLTCRRSRDEVTGHSSCAFRGTEGGSKRNGFAHFGEFGNEPKSEKVSSCQLEAFEQLKGYYSVGSWGWGERDRSECSWKLKLFAFIRWSCF